MTRQNISTGSTANDGTGDTLRSAGTKVNQNFVELYQAFGTDSNALTTGITFDSAQIIIAGTTNNTTITRQNPGTNVTFTIPDSSGEAVVIRSDNTVNFVDSTGTASKILYGNVYSAIGDLPSASTYHGMFAHVHATGKGYFAHGGNWHALLDSDTFTSRTDLQLVNPKMDTLIKDNTGTFGLLELDNLSSGNTSFVKITNINDSSPTITTDGTSTNIGLNVTPKGTEPIKLDGALVHSTVTYTDTANLDSGASTYLFTTGTAKSFTLHNGRYVGEVKNLINNTVNDVTVTTPIRVPGNLSKTALTLTDVNFVTVIWDGSKWILDRDSDKYITFTS
tara:strand:- start:17799 stop:18806 length:1008 start_codon:yes stop_codon:yes gene_type:complete